MGRPRTPLAVRFRALVDRRGPDECWPWIGDKDRAGYGKIRPGGPVDCQRANRVAYALEHGSVPDDLCVCHRCDNPACVNPAHLFLGTHGDNARDKVAKGRATAPRGEANHNAKLTDDAVRAIRASSERIYVLARRYGVSDIIIARVRNGTGWKHVV